MNDKKDDNVYDESSIKSLGLIGGIRARPTVYIERVGPRGVFKLLFETVQNAVDEASAGYCNEIDIDINTKKGIYSVKDNGRGIPIGKVHDIVTELHSGGKFSNSDGYSVHSGMNGMGLMVLNCLTDFMIIESNRDNKKAVFRYERGYKKSEDIKLEKTTKENIGTTVTFLPDITILKDVSIDVAFLKQQLEMISCINPGLKFVLNVDNKKTVFQFFGTISDYLEILMKRNKCSKMIAPIHMEFNGGELFTLKLTFSVSTSLDNELVYSYVNHFPTVDGGTHVDACKTSITRALTYYMKKNGLIPKTLKAPVSGKDIVESMFGLVLATHYEPQFDGQTKEKLTSPDIEKWISPLAYTSMLTWCENHPDETKKLIAFAIRKAKAKQAAKNAKELVMAPSTTKNLMNSKIDLKKFTDCRSNDSTKNELFIVEGDSAGGSAKSARDDNHQAVFAIKGKILNAANTKGLNDIQAALVEILGMGYGSKKDYSKLKYNKIFLLTDADPDGAHIVALLLTFLLRDFPELIENGHVFVCAPPFYQLEFKNKKKFSILNDKYFKFYKEEIALKTFDLIDNNEKVISERVFRHYIQNILGFREYLDVICEGLDLDPVLLELIVRNFDSLIGKRKYNQFKFFGFEVKEIKRTKNEIVFEFDKGFEHYYLRIDSSFYKEIYKPVYYRMCKFALSNIKLRGKNSKFIYGGTSYYLCGILDSTLENKNIKLKRYKGLGEMNHADLKETAMDPKTRKIVKVNMKNVKDAKYWTKVLMSNLEMKTKKKFLS